MEIKYIIKKDDISIKQILKEKYEMSEKLIIKLKQNKRIFLNNNSVYITHKIKENDLLYINLDFEETSDNIIPNKDIKLNIVYEDDYILILNKDAGISVHPSSSHYLDSLSNGVKYYFKKNNIKRKIRPVNRLDKNTSGLVIFSKSDYIQECLIKQMKNNTFKKYYIGILEGILDKKEGDIIAPISRKEGSIIERQVSDDGKSAITHFKVLRETNLYSEVEFLLKTGRTHQIRVHSMYIGHPIVGDELYGSKNSYNLNRHLLHAYKIVFLHPITKEILTIISDIPETFNEILQK